MESNDKPKGSHLWKPGQSGNPAGRQKGKANHVNMEVRERFKEIVENQMENVMEALDRIALEDPAKYVDTLTKLSAFFTPKMTEEVNKQAPPIFILPAGVQVPQQDLQSEENKEEQTED